MTTICDHSYQSRASQNLILTKHSRERLKQRFPGREEEIAQCCREAWRRLRGFVGSASFKHVHDDAVAVIADGLLITVYPRRSGGRS